MPYTINNPPELIKSLPNVAQKIWITAFNNSFKENKNEEKSIKIAWSAVKIAGYKKNNGIWKRWE